MRRPSERPQELAGLVPARRYPCDRCSVYEATRFGRAQVVDSERGSRWMDVGLCERCAAVCAAPGYRAASALGSEHTYTGK